MLQQKKGNFDCDRLDVNKEVMPKFVNAIHSEMSVFLSAKMFHTQIVHN